MKTRTKTHSVVTLWENLPSLVSLSAHFQMSRKEMLFITARLLKMAVEKDYRPPEFLSTMAWSEGAENSVTAFGKYLKYLHASYTRIARAKAKKKAHLAERRAIMDLIGKQTFEPFIVLDKVSFLPKYARHTLALFHLHVLENISPEYPRVCSNRKCGAVFIANRKTKRACSDACRQAIWLSDEENHRRRKLAAKLWHGRRPVR